MILLLSLPVALHLHAVVAGVSAGNRRCAEHCRPIALRVAGSATEPGVEPGRGQQLPEDGLRGLLARLPLPEHHARRRSGLALRRSLLILGVVLLSGAGVSALRFGSGAGGARGRDGVQRGFGVKVVLISLLHAARRDGGRRQRDARARKGLGELLLQRVVVRVERQNALFKDKEKHDGTNMKHVVLKLKFNVQGQFSDAICED